MCPIAATDVQGQASRLQVTSSAGLTYDASTSADDGVLAQFFAAYDTAFVLPNEKEGFAGFAACLALNEGWRYERLCSRYGPFREFVVVVHNAQGTIVGGLNFIIFPLHDPDLGRASLSLNLNYIFVQPSHRRRGVLKAIVGDLPKLALNLFLRTNTADVALDPGASPSSPAIYTFIEQNDPYRMTEQDYALDTRATDLDQLARIVLWARQGAKIIDFAYVQPALTTEQAADHNLVYAVLGATKSTLHPTLLRQHLERFFAISVLKGREPEANDEARQQLARLAELAVAGERIGLLEITEVASLPEPGRANGPGDTSTLRRVLSSV
jgi:GNAT superfamily N-acetyltransferase